MSFEEFPDGRRGGHLGHQNGTILAILNLYDAPMLHTVSVQSDLWFGRRCHLKNIKMDVGGGHLGYWNGTILTILNLYVPQMPPIKFWHNPTFGFGEDVVWIISRWPPSCPCWILERNDFSNSESLCHCDASHEVLAQSNLRFGRCHLKNFKMILDIGMEQF